MSKSEEIVATYRRYIRMDLDKSAADLKEKYPEILGEIKAVQVKREERWGIK